MLFEGRLREEDEKMDRIRNEKEKKMKLKVRLFRHEALGVRTVILQHAA